MTETSYTEIIAKLDELIEHLPDSFPAASQIIKSQIAPLIKDCDKGIQDHYIKLIKKKTRAESVKSVSMLIEESLKELDADEPENTDDHEHAYSIDDPEIREMANQIAIDPFLFMKKIDIITGMGVIGERRNIGIYMLVIDSRLIPMGLAGSEALAMKNSGHQGAGKSISLFSALKLYDKRHYYLISSGSEKSFYSIEGGLQFKALILSEALQLEAGSKDSELAYAIRTLLSEGHLTYQYTGFIDKKRTTIVKRIEGPTSLVTTTVAGKLEDQLDDRMITVHPNTSADQTRHIIRQTAQNACGNMNSVDDKLLRGYRQFHDSLQSIEVVIPFAEGIANHVGQQASLPLSARRAFKRFISGIKTMTLIHQKQRRKDAQGRLIADFIDYHLAYQLLEKSFAESLGKVGRHTDSRIKLIESLKRITPKALAEKTDVSVAAISQWIKPFIEKGTLAWCDENGLGFAESDALEKAKRTGKAFIHVAGGKCLPTTFKLSGDSRWDKGGELYEMFDLKLDEGDGALEMSDDAGIIDPDTESATIEERKSNGGVKVLNEKTQDDIKKMVENFKNARPEIDPDAPEVIELENEFEQILSKKTFNMVNELGVMIL